LSISSSAYYTTYGVYGGLGSGLDVQAFGTEEDIADAKVIRTSALKNGSDIARAF
jgi:hypothetical protein